MDDLRKITVSEKDLMSAAMHMSLTDEKLKEIMNEMPTLMVIFTFFIMKTFDYIYDQQKSIQENINKFNEKLKED